MMRWLGAVLVAGGGLWLGLGRARWHQGRVRALRALLRALEQLERELRETARPMADLLSVLAEPSGPLQGCFTACRVGLSELEERPFEAVWSSALQGADLPLTEEDLEPALGLGRVLGRYDQESQRKAIQSVRQTLEQSLEQALADRTRLGRLDCALGASVGLLAAILLL